jgi:hypothetical protein
VYAAEGVAWPNIDAGLSLKPTIDLFNKVSIVASACIS